MLLAMTASHPCTLFWTQSKGVQEYVEAETFYLYNLEGKVPSLEKLNAQLVFDDGVRCRLIRSPPQIQFGSMLMYHHSLSSNDCR